MGNKHIRICDFTKRELEYLIQECNFTPDELEYFNLRSRDKSNIEITFIMNISSSKADMLSKKIKSKILRVL